MEKQQKKQVKKVISWVLIVSIVGLLAALPMIAANDEPVSGPQASVLSAKAENRDIATAILGGGSLITEDALEITIPAAVKVTEYLVSNGDVVTEGQPVASVDRVSVMTAITQVQETLDILREELDDVSGETESAKVNATAGGTVKAIYASEGDGVRDVMLRYGTLGVISLDGMMAVRIERNTDLAGGDTVCVTFADGTEVEGRVESNLTGILTVTVDDEGYAIGENVKVTTEDGDRIGSGDLYVHNPWNVVAYSGVISRIRVSVDDVVKSGRTLFDLEETGYSAQLDALSRQHREYEALMLELFRMYQSETVNAPADGMITGVDETGAYMLAGGETGWKVTLLANAPNGDDESTYVNYAGMVAEVGIDGLIMKMNPQPFTITDYKDLSGVPADPALMTESVIYTADAPVYELADGEWIQISTASIAAGDLLLFAADASGGFVWVVRIARVAEEPAPPGPPDPTEPDTTDPTDPSEPTEPTEPTDPVPPDDRFPSGGDGFPGMGGISQEEVELYGLETVTIASVTGQDQVTVQITVDELDISRVFAGQSATVTVEALTGQQFEGTVVSVSGSGENEGGNSKFTVEVAVGKSAEMLPGMSAAVSIVLDTSANVVCIPVAALVENGTETLVYTGYDEETEAFTGEKQVETGISDGEYVQILSGIAQGQTVFYPYYDTLLISDVPEMGGGFPFG